MWQSIRAVIGKWMLGSISSRNSVRASAQKMPFALLIEQLLLLPVFVTLLAAAALAFGGHCSLWQWWMAVALVMALPFLNNRWLNALYADIAFLASLFAFWLLTGLTITETAWDPIGCHYPAIRMLMLGWNPIWQSTLEEMTLSTYLHADEFTAWHVLSMPKAVWYFSAVAGFFARNQFGLYAPVMYILLFGVILLLWRSLDGLPVALKLAIAVFVCNASNYFYRVADMTLQIAVLGLLVTQYNYLSKKEWWNIPMMVYSFWICSAKPLGLVFCVVIWVVFDIAVFLRERGRCRALVSKLSWMTGVVALMVALVNISPLVTNWVNYHHPFYPKYTVDEKRFPRRNLTNDFIDLANDDAKAMMNRPAMIMSAFICPDLVNKYYAWKLSNPGFNPGGATWQRPIGGGGHKFKSPLSRYHRCSFIIPILILLVLGGAAERFVASAMFLAAICVPVEMIGFIRYVPWIQLPTVFCVPLLWRSFSNRKFAKVLFAAMVIVSSLSLLFDLALDCASRLDNRLAISRCLKESLPDEVFYNQTSPGPKAVASLFLQKRLVPAMADLDCKETPRFIRRDLRRLNNQYALFFDGSFRTARSNNLDRYSFMKRYTASHPVPQGRIKKAIYSFKRASKSFAANIPSALKLRLAGKMSEGVSHSNGISRSDACLERSIKVLDNWTLDISTSRSDAAGIQIAGEPVGVTFWRTQNASRGGEGALVHLESLHLSKSARLCAQVKKKDGSPVEMKLKLGALDMPSDTAPGADKVSAYADFVSCRINGKEMLETPVAVSAKAPHIVTFQIENDELINLEILTRPHKYEYDDLRRLLLEHGKITFADDKCIDNVLSDKRLKEYL